MLLLLRDPAARHVLMAAAMAVVTLRPVRQLRYRRWFASVAAGAVPFHGRYRSFAEALADAPPTRPAGYDVPGAPDAHVDDMARVALSDYPVLHWLGTLLGAGTRVLDFGGHVGTKYRAFRPYLRYAQDLVWQVCDLPTVAAAGAARAAREGDPHLRFTTALADGDGADVLLASGVLQYVETPIWELLATLRTPPRHVLLNRLPCREGEAVVTLQNINVAVVPYQVYDERMLRAEMAALGYVLVDRWAVSDRHCAIPFHPEVATTHVGMYWRRDG